MLIELDGGALDAKEEVMIRKKSITSMALGLVLFVSSAAMAQEARQVQRGDDNRARPAQSMVIIADSITFARPGIAYCESICTLHGVVVVADSIATIRGPHAADSIATANRLYRVEIHEGSALRGAQRERLDADLRVRLVRTSRGLTVTLVDEKSRSALNQRGRGPAPPMGDPVPGVNVGLDLNAVGRVLEETTGTDGMVRFEGIPPGLHLLTWHDGNRCRARAVVIGGDGAARLVGWMRAEVSVGPEGS